MSKKIPDHAKLVFKGKIFDVYQWEQEMFDGSTEIFERLKRPNTVQVIATQGDNILLSFEEQPGKSPCYTFLGGRAEPNEEPLATAKRELLEEGGLESSDWELYKVYEPGGKIDWTIYLFIARDCKVVAEQKLDAGERVEVRSTNFEQFIEIVSAESFWASLITTDVLRMRLDPSRLEEFRRKLLGH